MSLKPQVDLLLSRATSAVFTAAQSSLDSVFDNAEVALGTATIDSTAGTKIAAQNPNLGVSENVDTQDAIDSLPAGATWLLEKVCSAVFSVNEKTDTSCSSETSLTLQD